MGFPRQEYWSALPFPSLGDLSGPGMKPMFQPVSSTLGANSFFFFFLEGGKFFSDEPPGQAT